MCSKGPKSSQILPQTLPKPSQNHPKPTQNPSRSPLGAHFGPMLERSSILKVQKTAKRRPKAPKGRLRQAQTLPKWRPRPSQIDFCWIFGCFFSSSKFPLIFPLFFTARTLKNYSFLTVKQHFLQNRNFPR